MPGIKSTIAITREPNRFTKIRRDTKTMQMTLDLSVIAVPNGYSRKNPKEKINVRPITFEEAQNGDFDGCIAFNGEYRDLRENGRVKTWKTRPGDLSIPVKYGLKNAFRVEYRNGRQQDSTGVTLVKKA